MLDVLTARAKKDGQVSGMIPNLMDNGVSILQHANVTIIFMEHDMAKTFNTKLTLCLVK